jgi:hypothetical protein
MDYGVTMAQDIKLVQYDHSLEVGQVSGIGSRPILALALRYLEPKSPVLGEIN